MPLPVFEKVDLDGTDFNKKIESDTTYLCLLEPDYVRDGQSHIVPRGWYMGTFNVFKDHCTFTCMDYIDVLLSEMKEVYKIKSEEDEI